MYIEGVSAGRYHLVWRHSIAERDFVDLCQAMLFMSGIDVRKIWFEYHEPMTE